MTHQLRSQRPGQELHITFHNQRAVIAIRFHTIPMQTGKLMMSRSEKLALISNTFSINHPNVLVFINTHTKHLERHITTEDIAMMNK